MIDLLKEANQEIPGWLETVAKEIQSYGGRGGSRGGSRGARGGSRDHRRFGGSSSERGGYASGGNE